MGQAVQTMAEAERNSTDSTGSSCNRRHHSVGNGSSGGTSGSGIIGEADSEMTEAESTMDQYGTPVAVHDKRALIIACIVGVIAWSMIGVILYVCYRLLSQW